MLKHLYETYSFIINSSALRHIKKIYRMVIEMEKSFIPIILGITGHRDIPRDDYDIIKNKIKETISELKKAYPNTPLILLTPLAEGGDRIAAIAANESEIEYIAPLPMPLEDYTKDFEEKASLEEFNSLLNGASSYYVLPNDGQVERSKLYEQVGVYIAKHCHILIALWDGMESSGQGGTAEIVEYKLKGIPYEYIESQLEIGHVDNGPVYHIMTNRLRNERIPAESITITKLYPSYWVNRGNAENEYNAILKSMDKFNKDIIDSNQTLISKIKQSIEFLIPNYEDKAFSKKDYTILERYAAADSFSIFYQKKKQLMLKLTLILSFVIVNSFLFYDEVWQSPLLLILYLTSIILAYILCFRNTIKDYHNKYLDYRALAEGLRVQLFWDMCGLDKDVSDYYLSMQKSEMEWIRNAIRALRIVKVNKKSATIEDIKTILDCWITAQYSYYKNAGLKNRKKLKGAELCISIFFVLNILVVSSLLIIEYLSPSLLDNTLFTTIWKIRQCPVSFLSLDKVILGLSAAIIALISTFSDKMNFSAQSKRYFKMEEMFKRAKNLLEGNIAKNDIEKSKKIIMEIGKQCLAENGEWVLSFRERPIEAPKG